MSNQLNVTLKLVNGVMHMDVADHGGENQVNQSPQPQTIVWQLTGNLAQGSFQPLDATPPGFAWKSNPPPSPTIFSAPSRDPVNGRTITIQDTHTSSASNGTWIYQLAVSLNGTVYTTTATSLMATTNNASIINK